MPRTKQPGSSSRQVDLQATKNVFCWTIGVESSWANAISIYPDELLSKKSGLVWVKTSLFPTV